MKPWLQYSLIRLGVFAVALTVLILVGLEPVPAAIIAALLGLCVGYIFFGSLRARVVAELAQRRAAVTPPRKDADAEAEDARIDS
ncbi:MAG: DUF4229 domain-containing protein [Rhodoglobus sp.]